MTSANPSVVLNEFSSDAIALQHQPPALRARLVLWTLAAFAVFAVIYAFTARMDIVVTGQGRVVPSGKTAVVQTAVPGRIHAVYVRDGQKVNVNDALIAFAPASTPIEPHTAANASTSAAPDAAPAAPFPGTLSTHALLDARLLESLSRLATLQSELTRRQAERDAVAGQIHSINASLPLVNKKHAMRQALAKTGHMAETGVIETQLEVFNLQKELSVQQNRLLELDAGLHAAIQQWTQAEAEFKARYPTEAIQIVRPQGNGQSQDGAHMLTAPVAGVVHWLSVPNVGQPVSIGQNLLVVVPENAPLEVEAMVLNKDIGHLEVGQRAIVKIETYDYTRYGYIDGVVQWVGTDAVIDPRLGPVYAARLSLGATETPNIVHGRRGRIAPGMNVTADVRVAERRMLDYFLAPLLRYKEESLRER